jgi:hypothetical protein
VLCSKIIVYSSPSGIQIASHAGLLFSFEQVPASVRVRRESAPPKGKPKPQVSASATASSLRPSPAAAGKLESTATPAGPKGQSVDDSYMAFLEEMKELGALDS